MISPVLHKCIGSIRRIFGKSALYCIFGTFGFLVAPQATADVEVWTDKERVILKGNLKGLKILPSGSKGKKQPGTAKGLPPKPKWKKKAKSAPKSASKTKKARAPKTIRVGPKERLKWPSLAALEARDGDTIEIAASDYVDCTTWKANNLTIRGVGGRAHVRDETCRGKAIWIVRGNNTTIENIEFSGMKVRDKNGAGIRHEGAGLTIRNSYFHDGEQGILGGGQRRGDIVLIEDSEFARLGKIGRAHPIYINRSEKLIIQNSHFHDCVDEANCVKSRAKHTVISCSVIASMNGNSSWELDLSNGGRAEIRNNVIQQGPKSVNRNIIGFAMETGNAKRRNSEQTLILEGNIIINDNMAGGQFINYRKRENTKLVVKGNKFIGPGKLQFKDKNNEFFHRRHIAKMEPYPALPPACKK